MVYYNLCDNNSDYHDINTCRGFYDSTRICQINSVSIRQQSHAPLYREVDRDRDVKATKKSMLKVL